MTTAFAKSSIVTKDQILEKTPAELRNFFVSNIGELPSFVQDLSFWSSLCKKVKNKDMQLWQIFSALRDEDNLSDKTKEELLAFFNIPVPIAPAASFFKPEPVETGSADKAKEFEELKKEMEETQKKLKNIDAKIEENQANIDNNTREKEENEKEKIDITEKINVQTEHNKKIAKDQVKIEMNSKTTEMTVGGVVFGAIGGGLIAATGGFAAPGVMAAMVGGGVVGGFAGFSIGISMQVISEVVLLKTVEDRLNFYQKNSFYSNLTCLSTGLFLLGTSLKNLALIPPDGLRDWLGIQFDFIFDDKITKDVLMKFVDNVMSCGKTIHDNREKIQSFFDVTPYGNKLNHCYSAHDKCQNLLENKEILKNIYSSLDKMKNDLIEKRTVLLKHLTSLNEMLELLSPKPTNKPY